VKGIVAIAVCIVALMVAIKDGRVLHTAGLTGVCSPVSQTVDGAELEACKPGKLEGRPDLTKRGCKAAGVKDALEYWRCPAGVQPTDAGR
jgi:hypothetical protein